MFREHRQCAIFLRRQCQWRALKSRCLRRKIDHQYTIVVDFMLWRVCLKPGKNSREFLAEHRHRKRLRHIICPASCVACEHVLLRIVRREKDHITLRKMRTERAPIAIRQIHIQKHHVRLHRQSRLSTGKSLCHLVAFRSQIVGQRARKQHIILHDQNPSHRITPFRSSISRKCCRIVAKVDFFNVVAVSFICIAIVQSS